MAIYNREIQSMTCKALAACTVEKPATVEKRIYLGPKDTGTISVTAKQTGATIRFLWRIDAGRISKAYAVKLMRYHDTVYRTLGADIKRANS